MDADLIGLGILALAGGLAFEFAARYVYPHLDAPRESLSSLRFLTTLIVGILLVLGLGLFLLGVFG
ncbi:hypothetical protein [Halostagnicola kamekurae]|uniref:Beta-ketoadipyl CoA thiolase n=1 Tax=Halostagnicola kamekurae TaxID=619731 RepID=A0A1I6RU05_9EURY|nr:hypothetical protein [Halostagnicola kamekurae]SFS68197.1 hypothetical protein SAMN04488556_2122 [Halostagnicola kamekurae]